MTVIFQAFDTALKLIKIFSEVSDFFKDSDKLIIDLLPVQKGRNVHSFSIVIQFRLRRRMIFWFRNS
jgi:hypothetical protein